ncbi:ATP-binding protein [Candidatus Woesearchaeota archaeon]|nr:ATP-binding protein [Candidatus Woesearchaeota archaeon]
MLTKEELKEIMNIDFPSSIPRQKYVEKILSWINRKEIIIIKGIRRSGKTHIMYQLMRKLPKSNTFYVNFDDFRFDKYLNTDLLEEILNLRNPKKKAYFFLDEIQRIKGFEKWLRTHYDRETNVKFIIGGSTISLLSKDMGTVLTGRNISFTVYPLSYEEFKQFTNKPLSNFLEFGGFPEAVLENNEVRKRELLEQYTSDIIARDILDKYKLDNPMQLKALIKFFLVNPGVRISANRLASQLGIHKDTAQKYISYVIDSFLIFEVPFFSYSAKTKYIASRAPKYYIIDNGLHTIASIKKNQSKLYENAAAIHLKRNKKEIMYWLDEAEIDFIYEKTAIQITSTDKIPKREIEAFTKFEKRHKGFEKLIVNPSNKANNEVNLIPIKEFLKEPKS